MAGFVAVWFNKLSVDRVKLLQALAALQLFVTAVNLVTGRGIGDKVAPALTINFAELKLSSRMLLHMSYRSQKINPPQLYASLDLQVDVVRIEEV